MQSLALKKEFLGCQSLLRGTMVILLIFVGFLAGDVIKMSKMYFFFQNPSLLTETHHWSKFGPNWTIFWKKILDSPGTTLSEL